MYNVVEFSKSTNDKTNPIAVIPDNWWDIAGNQCILWPAHKSKATVEKWAKQGVAPTSEWKAYPVLRSLWKTCKWNQFVKPM